MLKFGFPRSDLQVVVNGVTVRPAFALGSWVAFQRISDHAMVMGDLVLLSTEVESVMASLQQNGIEQTALHNHLLGESPRVMYMHIRAIGNPARIARAIRTRSSSRPPHSGRRRAAVATTMDIDTVGMASALKVERKIERRRVPGHDPAPREDPRREDEVAPSMGVATALNFQPTGPERLP